MKGIKPPKLILLIDDETSIQELVHACLSDLAGWTVITVSSAQEGLKRLASERPDVILLDLLMPGMNGITFIQNLYKNPAARTIPIILLTVQAGYFTPKKLQQLGVIDAIAKPFNPVTLPEMIAQTLGWNAPVEE
ncbi:MAG: response regulator [Stenomitos rutilans HA7619-LM2]|jgi:CheY-like chemotaxis protein|nr:response regulator [Stenomitos rutilans HA7619-LM2]